MTLVGPLGIKTSRIHKKHSMGSGGDWFPANLEAWSAWVLLPSLLLLHRHCISLLCQLCLLFLFPSLLLCLFMLHHLLLGKSFLKKKVFFLRVRQFLLRMFHRLLMLMLRPRHLPVMLLGLREECPLQLFHFVCLLLL